MAAKRPPANQLGLRKDINCTSLPEDAANGHGDLAQLPALDGDDATHEGQNTALPKAVLGLGRPQPTLEAEVSPDVRAFATEQAGAGWSRG